MKLNDFFDFCISKRQELEDELELAQSECKDFNDFKSWIELDYEISSFQENDSLTVRFDVGCGKLLIGISFFDSTYKRKHRYEGSVDAFLRFRPKHNRHGIVEFYIEDLDSKKGRGKLKKELGMYFDDGKYIIEVAVMDDHRSCSSSYERGLIGLCYETREEAIIEARKLAEKLNKKYKKCHCIKVCEGFTRDEDGYIVGCDIDSYTISSKSKSETMRARRMSGFLNLEVDEYVGQEPEIDKSNTIIVMSVVSGEKNEYSTAEFGKYKSLLEVETAINKHVDEWLEKNEYTLNFEEADDEYLSYAEIEDDGEEVYACHVESKTELRIFRKEFKL